MQIKWYGHSCFLLTGNDGLSVLTDPCEPRTGYQIAGIETDFITSSHAHSDHNYFAAAKGSPIVVNTAGEHTFMSPYGGDGVRITGIPTWHDGACGAERGVNLVFVIEMDGLRAVHLGDLGHLPDAQTVAAIGRADLLFLPIGGVFTIDAAAAHEVLALLRPHLVIPMHYSTPALAFHLDGPEAFLSGLSGYTIHRLRQSECSVHPQTLGTPRALVFDYVK